MSKENLLLGGPVHPWLASLGQEKLAATYLQHTRGLVLMHGIVVLGQWGVVEGQIAGCLGGPCVGEKGAKWG